MLTFLRFARAHTIVGTSLSILALFALAGRRVGDFDWTLLGLTLFSCLAANVYITGLNQLTDVGIDRINKPYLPLASGAYSMRTGRAIIIICLLLSLFTALASTPYLATTVTLSLLLGTAYSLPPVRLKRYAFWAAFCILAVRGLIVNLLLYLHFQYAGGGGQVIPPVIWLLTGIIFAFSIIIAWYKDLPDTAGDAAHNIETLTLIRGRRSVWQLGALLLAIMFAVSAGVAWWLGKPILAIGQGVLLGLLVLFSLRLDLDDERSIARYYQRIWVLFFLEYALFGIWG